MADPSDRPAVRRFVAVLSVLAVAALVEAAFDARSDGFLGPRPWAAAVFGLLVVLAELRARQWWSVDRSGEVTGSWAFAFALLYVAPPLTVCVVLALAGIAGELWRGKPLVRVVFNASDLVLSVWCAAVTTALVTDPLALARGASPSPRWLAGAILGAGTAFVVNSLLTSAIVALHTELPFRSVLRAAIGAEVVMDGLLWGSAPVFALVATHGFVLLPVLLLTVWAIYRSAGLAVSNRHDARHDPLTGLPNRRFLTDEAPALLAPASVRQRVAVVHLDLDDFKAVNDRLGHHVGDAVLVAVAARLGRAGGPRDLVARLGGDEFVILVRGVPAALATDAVLAPFVAALEQPVALADGVEIPTRASMGVSFAPEHGTDLDALLRRADQAMYVTKHARKVASTLPAPGPPAAPAGPVVPAAVEVGYRPVLAVFPDGTRDANRATPAVREVLALIDPQPGDTTWAVAATVAADMASWRNQAVAVNVTVAVPALVTTLAAPGAVGRWLEEFATRGIDRTAVRAVLHGTGGSAGGTSTELVTRVVRTASALGLAVDLCDPGTVAELDALVSLAEVARMRIDASVLDLDTGEREARDLVVLRRHVAVARALGWRVVLDGDVDGTGIDEARRLGVEALSGSTLGRPWRSGDVPSGLGHLGRELSLDG